MEVISGVLSNDLEPGVLFWATECVSLLSTLSGQYTSFRTRTTTFLKSDLEGHVQPFSEIDNLTTSLSDLSAVWR